MRASLRTGTCGGRGTRDVPDGTRGRSTGAFLIGRQVAHRSNGRPRREQSAHDGEGAPRAHAEGAPRRRRGRGPEGAQPAAGSDGAGPAAGSSVTVSSTVRVAPPAVVMRSRKVPVV